MVKVTLTRIMWVIIICLLIPISCNQYPAVTPFISTSTKRGMTSLSTSTLIPTRKILQSTSMQPSLTMTVSPTLKLTPLPTLSRQESQNKIAHLMETNDNCSGACFWSIDLNSTNYDQAVQLLEMIGESGLQEMKGVYTNFYQYEDKNIGVSLNLSRTAEQIKGLRATVNGLDTLNVTGKDWLAFRPDSFVREHGAPNKIFVVMSEGPEGRLGYGFAFLYDEMVILYNSSQIVYKPQKVLHACPNKDHNVDRFDLWIGQYDQGILNGWVNLTSMSSLTANDLFENFVNNGEMACFDLDYDKFILPK